MPQSQGQTKLSKRPELNIGTATLSQEETVLRGKAKLNGFAMRTGTKLNRGAAARGYQETPT